MIPFSATKKTVLSLLAAGVFVLLYSPLLAGQRELPKAELSLRQRTEILFQNGMRNAQMHDDVYGQMQALQKTLSKVHELRLENRTKLSARDEKDIGRRVKQLKRMISRQVANETL